MPLRIESQVPLAPKTTLQLGGAAERFARATSQGELIEALQLARDGGWPVHVLGGGSNLVVADAGVPGLVVQLATRGVQQQRRDGLVLVTAQAGESWDALVARAVADDLAGIECLSGIPGFVGATPIQNVGAYGQEVSDVIVHVTALDRRTLQAVTLSPAQCGFGYRHSAFKADPERYVVLQVCFGLREHGAPALRYPELQKALRGERAPTLAQVRDTVLSLRRAKSMLLDPLDPNSRSAGSFFVNPIVDARQAARLRAAHPDMPQYPQPDGRVKLAAGWLMERAGVRKGERHGAVGVSTKHALALVHHGGGSTTELLVLAHQLRERVRQRFGVTLAPEPVLWGMDGAAPA